VEAEVQGSLWTYFSYPIDYYTYLWNCVDTCLMLTATIAAVIGLALAFFQGLAEIALLFAIIGSITGCHTVSLYQNAGIDQLASSADNLEQTGENFLQASQRISQEGVGLRESLQLAQQNVAALESTCTELRSTLQQTQQQLDDRTASESTLASSNEKLHENNLKLQEEIQKLQLSSKDLQSLVNKHAETLERTDATTVRVRKGSDDLGTNTNRLAQTISQLDSTFDENTAQLNVTISRVSSISQQSAPFDTSLLALRKVDESLDEDYAQLSAKAMELRGIQEQIRIKTQDLETLEKSLSAKHQTLVEEEARAGVQRQAFSQLLSTYHETQLKLEKATQLLEQKKQEFAQVSDQLAQGLETVQKAKESQITALDNKILEKRKILNDLIAKIAEKTQGTAATS
jgi:chromosome segregation ATPase